MTPIAAARLRPYRLRLAAPHADARGGFAVREGVLLELDDAEGRSAVGDCCPLPGPGGPLETAAAALRDTLPGLIGIDPLKLVERRAADALPVPGPAAFALESAAGFLAARQHGVPLAAVLAPGASRPLSLNVNALVDAEDAGEALAQAETAASEGYTVFKVKAGLGRVRDLALVRTLRERLGTGAGLRVDANGSWTGEEFLELAPALVDAKVDLVEQPVPPEEAARPGRLAELRARTALRLALDESLADPDAAPLLITPESCDAVALKPSQLGLLAAARLARCARAAGVDVIVTGAFESAAGFAAVLEFAAAFGSPGTAHGLATALAVVGDSVEGVPKPAGGAIALPSSGVFPQTMSARRQVRR